MSWEEAVDRIRRGFANPDVEQVTDTADAVTFRLISLCLCKKLGKRDLKSISDRKGLKSPSVQLTTKMRQATHLSGSLSHFSVGGYLHC